MKGEKSMSNYSRRRFLQGAAGAVAVAALPKFARADVNSQIRMATIGLNGRGQSHLGGFQDNIVAICDCDRKVLGRSGSDFERRTGRKIDQIVDFRDLLDRDDIDAVSIATPNHTHALIAIAAAEAGKHVYCEKPVSQCLWEGRQIVNAARKYNRLIQCGTQARSSRCNQEAVEYVRSGKLGKVQYVVGTCFKPRPSIGKLDQPLEIPPSIDYDLWCGPAAKVDLYRPHLHYDWHWDYNTGCGDIGNQGVHQMDVARWYLGEPKLPPRVASVGGRLGYVDAGNTPNSQTVLLDYAAAPLIFETRGLPKSKADQRRWADSMDNYRGSQIGVVVQCDDGYILSSASYQTVEAYNPAGEQIKKWRGGGNHFRNFLDAVSSGRREDLNAEIEVGHVSSALCHMANISHRLGQPRSATEIRQAVAGKPLFAESVDRLLEHLRANEIDVDSASVTLGPMLEFDSEREQFTANGAANHLARREDRRPFVVPEIA
jgi:predicted dehydrogenase